MLFTSNRNQEIDLDSRGALIAAMMMCVIGPEVVMVEPVWVEGLVQHAGFTVAEAQSIMAAELAGIWSATVTMAFIAYRLNWRALFGWSLLVMVFGNLATIPVNDYGALLALRVIVGIAAGMIISLSFTVVGLTSNPDRNFGYLMVWVLVYAAVANPVLPTLYALRGIDAALVAFAMFAACGLPFVRFLPGSGKQPSNTGADSIDLSLLLKGSALGAMLSYFLAIGLIWAFLSLIGTNANLGEQLVASSIGVAQIFGIAGGVTAVLLGARCGRAWPIGLGIVGGIGSLWFLFGTMQIVVFAACTCLFLYTWNVCHAYLYAAMASFDRSGRIVVYAVPMQMTGFALAPMIGTLLITKGDYDGVVWLAMVFFATALCLILPPVLAHAKAVSRSS
mgnify:CR=1 FL=1